ncbi:hypothetical protein BGX21_006900, partial [Mortierella sp. AD011]
MTSEKVKLFCILDGDITAFPCNISSDESVGDLKDAIKKKQSPLLDDIRANDLILWRVFIASSPKRQILLSSLIEEKDNTPKELEDPTNEISEVFGAAPAKKTIHVIVQRPVAHCIVQRPVAAPEDLETTIRKITERFFAKDSPAAIFLNEYVKGARELPVTTEGIKGLPRCWRRGKTTAPESRPNFLFLDLPTSSTENIPERFLSNVILQELEKTEAQDVPVFGVSG